MDKEAAAIRFANWEQLIVAANSSGLRKREWCAQNGITEKSFYYWQRKVREKAIETMKALKPVGESMPAAIQQDLGMGVLGDLPGSLWRCLCEGPSSCGKVRHRSGRFEGSTVITINDGSCDAIASLLELLRRSGVNVVFRSATGMNMFWESAFQGTVQLVPLCWNDILINMKVVPFAECYELPYGFFYRTKPKPAVQKFLD